jgi:hypothetical protein
MAATRVESERERRGALGGIEPSAVAGTARRQL